MTENAGPAAPALGRRLDAAGIGLAVASVAWTAWTARASIADAAPVAALQTGCVAAYATARWVSVRARAAVPLAALALGGGVLVLGTVLPRLGRTGYENADASLCVQLAIAGAMAARALHPGRPAWAAGGVAAVFALATGLSGSVAAIVALALVALLRTAGAARMPALAVGLGAIAVVAVVAGTAFVAVARVSGVAPGVVADVGHAADARRVALWADAASIAHAHPWAGAGPGRFERLSPTARQDRDARWAHSDFLQQAAEGGAVAMALLLAAFGWGFARVWAAAVDDPAAVLGAMALTALGMHGAVDYVLRFPLLTMTAVALVGAATAPRPARAAGIPG